jgi:hypothetical protein
MFNKLFGDSKKDKRSRSSDLDLSFGYSRTQEFKNYLTTHQYGLFETEYINLGWDAQTLLNEGIALDKDWADDIQKWVEQSPDSYVSNLFAGVSKTGLAWIARTAARDSNVSEENANRFFELLEEAMQYLLRADEINPDDAEICARIIRVYMGLGIEEEKVLGFFNAAASLVPNHLMAHLMMINYLNPKWQGNLESMHHFADQRIEDSGSSLLITLKLFAITEEWLNYDLNGEGRKHKQFFNDENLRTSISNMYNEYREEEDGQLLIPYVYNYFAFLFWMMGNKERAREIIRKIPGQMTVYPWAYLNIESNAQLQRM